MSSAYTYKDPELTEAGRSFVNSVNKVGPSTEPWGMPKDTCERSDLTPSNTVSCCLPSK